MSSNPNNYPGASITLVGYIAGPAKPPLWDKEGTSGVIEVSIPISEGYKKDGEFVQTGTTWYRYSAAGDYAANLKKLGKGDKVRIEDAKQEVREYEGKDGKALAIGLRFGSISVLESKSGASNDVDAFPPAGGGW